MKKISLSQKEFKSSIAKGRGLIIQFLKQISPATEKYDELIKWGCMNLTNLSMQDDGPNEEYYFDIINLSGLKDKIVSGMISYVSEYWAIHCSKDIEDKDFNSYYKVFCILCLFAKYDHELSDILQATYKKIFFYSDIITQNPIIKSSTGRYVRNSKTINLENTCKTLARFLFVPISKISMACFKNVTIFILENIDYKGLFELEDFFWDYTYSEEFRNQIIKNAETDIRFNIIIDYFSDKIKDDVNIARKLRTIKDIRTVAEHKMDDFLKNPELVVKKIKLCKGKYQIEELTLSIINSMEYTGAVNLDILLELYKRTYCTCCRNYIVSYMITCKIIPTYILHECLYDCRSDTRKLAKEYLDLMNINE